MYTIDNLLHVREVGSTAGEESNLSSCLAKNLLTSEWGTEAAVRMTSNTWELQKHTDLSSAGSGDDRVETLVEKVLPCPIRLAHCSGRASFRGDAFAVRKWRGNLHTKIRKCVPTKRSRETNAAFQKHRYHCVHQTIQRNKMFCANDARFLFSYSRMFLDRLYLVSFETCWDRVSCFCLRCTHRFHDFAYG